MMQKQSIDPEKEPRIHNNQQGDTARKTI